MYYSRLCRTTKDRGTLIPTEEILEHIDDYETDWYESIFQYNEVQFQQFLETKTVAGILDVTTSKLVFDLDSKDNLDAARKDAITLVTRLQADISLEAIQIYFSGKKGFTIVVETNQRFTPTQLRSVCLTKFGKDLKTLDEAIYNASRILRVPHTKHQETGLYKIDIAAGELENSIEDIKKYAESNGSVQDYGIAQLSNSFVPKEFVIKKDLHIEKATDKFLDLTLKPAYLTNCKYAILHGHFSEGFRTLSLLYLGATYKNQGFPLEVTYRLLKGSAELQAQKHNNDRLPDEEIYQIVSQVYGPNWKGGQGSCRPGTKTEDLRSFCQSLGEYACKHEKSGELTVNVNNVFSMFSEYASHYKENILYTGIADLDDKAKFMVGTSNNIIGPPGVGKTSMILQILKHNSDQGIPSIFFSYDMFHAAVYMRMLQNETGMSQDELYDIFRSDKKKSESIHAKLKETYKNVEFCFKPMQTPDEIVETINETEQKLGKKVKLIVIDYNELVRADASDPTAASAEVAQKIRQIANEQEVCAITLLQPSKLYSKPNDDITTFNSAKGSSSIAQAATVILGISRPGYNPRHPEVDKFFTITCVKNRNGSLFGFDLHWDGLRGKVRELTDEERIELDELRDSLAEEREQGSTFNRFTGR